MEETADTVAKRGAAGTQREEGEEQSESNAAKDEEDEEQKRRAEAEHFSHAGTTSMGYEK